MILLSSIQNTKPHLYEKWGFNNQPIATSRLKGICLTFFAIFV